MEFFLCPFLRTGNAILPNIHSLRFDSEQENQNGGIKNEQKHSECL